MKIKISVFVMLLMFLLSACGQEEKGKESASILFFYSNACESCKEEEEFDRIVKKELLPQKEELPYEYQYYNTFKTEGRAKYEEAIKKLGVDQETAPVPLMVIDDKFIVGYEEIEEQILSRVREAIKGEDIQGINAVEKEEVVVLYTTLACKECEKVKLEIENLELPVQIEERNITEEVHAQSMMDDFVKQGVSDNEQQVPILFWNGNYASGSKAILDTFEEAEWWNREGETQGVTGESLIDGLQVHDLWKIIVAGLLNGLNPCALSMLFFLLSLFAGTKGSVGKIGTAYLVGKFVAYFGMGIGIFRFLAIAEGALLRFYEGMKYVLLAAVLILAFLNFLDFIAVLRKEYGKVRMQLPAKLRKWNQDRIKTVGMKSGRWLLLFVLLLGILISAGEFFCTGQIYAAVLLMLLRTAVEWKGMVYIAILCYVMALCIPSIVCVFAIAKGKSVLEASDKTLHYMPFIKLGNCILFLVLALFFAFS